MNDQYRIVEDFQAGPSGVRVLVLDRDFDSFDTAKKWRAVIDGKEYKFGLNSIGRWVTIESEDSFTGKTIAFV